MVKIFNQYKKIILMNTITLQDIFFMVIIICSIVVSIILKGGYRTFFIVFAALMFIAVFLKILVRLIEYKKLEKSKDSYVEINPINLETKKKIIFGFNSSFIERFLFNPNMHTPKLNCFGSYRIIFGFTIKYGVKVTFMYEDSEITSQTEYLFYQMINEDSLSDLHNVKFFYNPNVKKHKIIFGCIEE